MFQVETSIGTSTVLRVRSDVDVYCKERFIRALQLATDGGPRQLVVSLEECRFVDCSGIGVLVAARNALGSRLKIVSPAQTFVRRIFDILELAEPLDIFSSVDEALAAPSSTNGSTHSR